MKYNLIIFAFSIFILSSCMKAHYKREWEKHVKIEEDCKIKTKEWILSAAKNPLTYEQISFGQLEEWAIVQKGNRIENSERYSIKHKYILQDSSNTKIIAHHRFDFNLNFELVDIVKVVDSNAISGNLDLWKIQFGK